MREMKDSGVEWIGEIPKDWNVVRLKYLLNEPLQYGANESGVEYSPELPRYIRITDITVDSRLKDAGKLSLTEEMAEGFVLKDQDILFARSGATVGKTFIYLREYGVAAFAGYLIKASLEQNKILPKYVYYYTLGSHYDKWKNVIFNQATIQNIGADKYSNLYISMPSVFESQGRIVAYLDSKCSQIDAIIEKQQTIIEKLKEYKLSVITEAVTKGINPDVEMKYSGSVWFGDIPKNWEMKRLKYVFHIQKDIVGEEGHTVLSITQRGIVPKDFSNNDGQFANSYANYQLVHVGNFAMNHMDLLTGWVDISKYEGVTSPDYRVFVLDDTEKNYSEYYLYLMQMCYSARIFYGLGQGVSGMGRWRLQADKFLNFRIPVPPFNEQKAIAEYVDTKIVEIERSIEKRTKLIEKLQEYKKSLIYEVVTGKKEV